MDTCGGKTVDALGSVTAPRMGMMMRPSSGALDAASKRAPRVDEWFEREGCCAGG